MIPKVPFLPREAVREKHPNDYYSRDEKLESSARVNIQRLFGLLSNMASDITVVITFFSRWGPEAMYYYMAQLMPVYSSISTDSKMIKNH